MLNQMTTTTTITQTKLSYEKPNILVVKLKMESQLMGGSPITPEGQPGGGAGGGTQGGVMSNNSAKYFFEELFDYADADGYDRFDADGYDDF